MHLLHFSGENPLKTRHILEGVGAALLLLLTYIWPCVEPFHIALYHHRLPASNLVGGLLVDLLALSLLAIWAQFAIDYLPAPAKKILDVLFVALVLWRIVDVAIQVQANEQIIADWERARMLSFIGLFLLLGALAHFLVRRTELFLRAVHLLIASFALCALWVVPELVFVTIAHGPNESSTYRRISLQHRAPNKRIVWILFDELSYDQTFDHPNPEIQLPNLDRFRDESVSFTNLQPAGYYTDRIIPSLLLGRRIDRIRGTLQGDLWYLDESENRWVPYDPDATLFGLAKLNGWNSGVDGWFNPYCRILGSVLNVCYWEPQNAPPLPMEKYGASEEKSVLSNAVILPKVYFSKLTSESLVSPIELTKDRLQQYVNVMARTKMLIDDNQVQFVFLHLPIPHPPGIYDRNRHALRSGGSYLDNLVLTDDTLGTLLKEIDTTPLAGETTVIISSDHSWRIPLWRPGLDWRSEEESASGARFDERPVLLIHFPGETAKKEIDTALPEMVEHDMIADMLRGRMDSPTDLTVFFKQAGHGK
jgi:Sulfatase